MGWIRLDQGFPEHPKVLAAGEDAAWLFVCMIAYSNRFETDGFVTERALRSISKRRNPVSLCTILASVGLLEIVSGGYLIHDYLDYQPSRSEAESRRSGARERMAKVRARSQDVRANFAGTSGERSQELRSTRSGPVRSVPMSSSSSTGSSAVGPDLDEVSPTSDGRRVWLPGLEAAPAIDHAIRIHAAWSARSAERPRAYAQTVALNDRSEHMGALVAAYNADRSLTGPLLARSVFGLSEVDAHIFGRETAS